MPQEQVRLIISSMLTEIGYESADTITVETLAEMFRSIIFEIGRSTMSYAELSGRVEPLPADVLVAAINMGLSLYDLHSYATRPNRSILPEPSHPVPPKIQPCLQVGVKQPHPSYFPPYLPSFPDPYAYIRTPTYKKPITDYKALREKAAFQKRYVKKALNNHLVSYLDTESLFFNSVSDPFKLIAVKPNFPPCLNALLPKDQVFEEVYEQEEDDIVSEISQKKGKDDEETEAAKVYMECLADNPYVRCIKK